MKFFELKNEQGEVLYESRSFSWKECLEEAVKRGVNLHGINLAGTNVVCTDLRNAVMPYANALYVSFYGVDLRHADLSQANLQRANFDEADLWGIDLTGSNWWEAYGISEELREMFHLEFPKPEGE